MADLKELLQSADWKTEKHAPVIELQDNVKKGELFKVTVSVGKEIAHPNKTEHHICWIEIYFQPQTEKFPYAVARAEFSAHGASVNGADTSTIYTHPEVTASFKTDKSGIIYAASYCNIHGLWQSSKELKIT
ncbi:MAG: class II SORL domain-containing protein [Candidatus Omnitrophota bacterium]|jgi:superoxide reductase|nr:class II SORL domain-containing protein [Candidatus Omnitrophota bacterium]MDD5518639.1 class II SORL domain-containing protein [Candidatus Omnitrophota bacterium]